MRDHTAADPVPVSDPDPDDRVAELVVIEGLKGVRIDDRSAFSIGNGSGIGFGIGFMRMQGRHKCRP